MMTTKKAKTTLQMPAQHPPAHHPPQLWITVRQRDATREAALKLYRRRGATVSRDLLPTALPPFAVCDEVSMTHEERMRALGCMGRAMVMLELTHGAGIPGTWTVAVARKMAVCMNH